MTDTPLMHRGENRLVVVDETGRVYDRDGVKIEWSVQDGAQTLKVFVTPLPRDEEVKAKQHHEDNFADSLRRGVEFAESLLRGRR